MISEIKNGVRQARDRLFIEREIILRTDGKVRYLRLSKRFQEAIGVACLGLACWIAFATGSYLLHADTIASKEQEIETHRLAYVTLLSEVDEYQDEFARITRDLEGNQTDLLTLLDEEAAEEARTAADERTDRDESGEDGVSGRMLGFADELDAIANRNTSLREEVGKIRELLQSSEHERSAVQSAQRELGAKLAEVQANLEKITTARNQLKQTVGDLNEELARSRAEREVLVVAEADLRRDIEALKAEIVETSGRETALNQRIGELEKALAVEVARALDLGGQRDQYEGRVAELEREITESVAHAEGLSSTIAKLEQSLEESLSQAAELEDQRDFYETRVATLERQLESTDDDEQQFDRTIANLKASLAAATGRNTRLEQQRDFYEQRVTNLENRLEDMRGSQQTIVKRISDRTMISLETMEKTLAITGLDIGNLFSHADVDPTGLGQGGPFVPGNYISETDYGDDLLASVRVLDMQMSRWEAMQEIFRRLPLIPPLDHYRLSSGFGPRVDPINGRKAVHHGIDMGAPLRTPVLSTAPGRIVFAGWRGRYGRMIEVDHGLGIHTRYGHLKKILVKPGQQVEHREKIGLLGSSGRSTGPHVHYEVLVNGKPYDPTKFLKAGRYVFKG